ncbi:unnamed protein product [Chilo suppressalis]|uniref:WW domain-containing protein n=1 Tax=Chilo suppressalis TaxID=168631 RepID=A0ABN8AWB2_CHISP|nr:unnamed protein product [Chilo suppressalis]
MNNKKDKNESIQTVTALRNSWVVCKSKSHAGHIYYFNTLTGEAVWNLSDAEIEKANKRTKILQSQPGSNLESCPEPKDPPTDSVMTYKKDNSQESVNYPPSYNNHIMNNPYPKQQFQNTPFINTQCFNCTSHNVSDSNCVSMATPPTINPSIWAIPPNHQIVIAPTTPLINQSQSPFEMAYSNLQHVPKNNQSLLHMRRSNLPYKHQNTSKNYRCNNVYNKFNQRKNFMNFNYQQKNSSQFFNDACGPSTSRDDLRQKLAAKRCNYGKLNGSDNQGKGSYSFKSASQQRSPEPKIQIIKSTTKELCPFDEDDNWLKEHAYVEGTQLKLNVTPLKNIVMLDEKGYWYIVADSNTLLEHFKLINVIVNSDEQCQLMVPDDIMAELQMKSRSDDTQLMSRTHSVLQYLSHQFITGGAVIGKDSTNDSNNILDFTLKLAEQNHNVALFSNYIERKEGYNNIGIPIFMIQDIKELLENKSILKNQSETSLINITIHNNTSNENNFSDVTSQKETNENEVNIGKHTLEMGVQTEFDFTEDKIEKPATVNFNKNSIDTNHTSIQPSGQVRNISHNSDSDCKTVTPAKRREIRLKRNIPQQLPSIAENNTEKKHYKWRRRKNTVVETPTESNETNTDVANTVVNKPNELTTLGIDETPNDPSFCNRLEENNQIITENYDDNYSDTTNGPCFSYKDITKKTIVDETSTSGIISNTASNVDSESLHSLKQNVSTNDKYNDQETNKCVMFEVENTIMEERLQMRTDEWLSRFVQIMEEILTQILCLNPSFNHRSLPPPWTLHEATECIKKKFHADCDIRDAASKLTEILYHNSNERGVINARLKPSSFMEMYSYGVYLVDSLQTAIDNCEDLQIAADSLAKLLADIQSADSYGVNNDSFNDNIEDPSANVTFCGSATSTEKDSTCTSNITKSNIVISDNRSGELIAKNGRSYNLRSNQNKSEEKIESPPCVKFIRTIDKEATFFSCLNLQRKQSNILNESVENSVEEDIIENPNYSTSNQNTTEPKIIRRFNIDAVFEERLRSKQREVLDLDSLDYTEDEYYDDEYYNYDYYINDNEDLPDMNIDHDDVGKLDEKDAINDSQWVINKTVHEVQQVLLQVRDFCNNTREELIASQPLSPDRRQKIQERAENARVHLNNLFESLNSIYNREDMECGANILTILNEAGVSLDSCQAADYRTVIGKRIEQGLFLLESVNIVLEAVTCE